MAELFRGGALALLVILQELLRPIVGEFLSIESPWPALISLSTVIVLYVLFDRFFYLSRRLKIYRRTFMKQSHYEGFWISRVEDSGAPCSISKLFYSTRRDRWVHKGNAYNSDNQLIRSWEVESIYFDKALSEWFFNGKFWTCSQHNPRAKIDPKDQIAILDVPKQRHNLMVSMYLDEPRSPQFSRAGRAEMRFLSKDRIYQSTGRRPRKIEDISPEMAKKLCGMRDTLFEEFD